MLHCFNQCQFFFNYIYDILFALLNIFSGSSFYSIFSYSKSVLMILSVLWTLHPWWGKFRTGFKRLQARHKTMDFCWFPSHLIILGDESWFCYLSSLYNIFYASPSISPWFLFYLEERSLHEKENLNGKLQHTI